MNDEQQEAATITAAHTQGAIPSPAWTEAQRQGAVIAELREKAGALAAANATLTARAEAAEARVLEEEAISYDIAAKAALDAQNWREELTVMRQRLEAAEAKLAAVPDYVAYYVTAWESFEADSDGPEPLDFAEWLAQRASSQRSE